MQITYYRGEPMPAGITETEMRARIAVRTAARAYARVQLDVDAEPAAYRRLQAAQRRLARAQEGR